MNEQKEDQVNGEQGKGAGLAKALEVAVSQRSISGFRLITDALQQFKEHNKSLMAEITMVSTDTLTRSITHSLAVNADFSKLINAQAIFPDISKAIRPPAYEALYSANLSIGKLFDSTNVIAKSFAQLSSVSKIWQSQLRSVSSVLGKVQYPKIVLDSHLGVCPSNG